MHASRSVVAWADLEGAVRVLCPFRNALRALHLRLPLGLLVVSLVSTRVYVRVRVCVRV